MEDRKFKYEDSRFINRVSGEPIPDDEPVILFRARDRHTVALLCFYKSLVSDPHHQQAVQNRIDEFTTFQEEHPERVKEPGVTRHIELNSDFREPRHTEI